MLNFDNARTKETRIIVSFWFHMTSLASVYDVVSFVCPQIFLSNDILKTSFEQRYISVAYCCTIYIKRRCEVIANKTALNKRPNDTEIHNGRSPYAREQ